MSLPSKKTKLFRHSLKVSPSCFEETTKQDFSTIDLDSHLASPSPTSVFDFGSPDGCQSSKNYLVVSSDETKTDTCPTPKTKVNTWVDEDICHESKTRDATLQAHREDLAFCRTIVQLRTHLRPIRKALRQALKEEMDTKPYVEVLCQILMDFIDPTHPFHHNFASFIFWFIACLAREVKDLSERLKDFSDRLKVYYSSLQNLREPFVNPFDYVYAEMRSPVEDFLQSSKSLYNPDSSFVDPDEEEDARKNGNWVGKRISVPMHLSKCRSKGYQWYPGTISGWVYWYEHDTCFSFPKKIQVCYDDGDIRNYPGLCGKWFKWLN